MKSTTLGVAVIGLGSFGRKRVRSIVANAQSSLQIVADAVPSVAENAGAEFGCDHTANWEQAVIRSDVDVVVVSTATRFLAEITSAAIEAGKHVLCEKPFGRTAGEVLPAVESAERKRLCLKAGYNHRYHPALRQAQDLFQQGIVGRLHFMRCIYGHGGRTNYEKEWRTQLHLAGGGQLLDQGVHTLDLFRWIAGEFAEVKAYTTASFWPISPLEDNVFALLQAESGCIASLHASWTNWKNTFVFELSGENGYLKVSGLGGHYGVERLCYGRRNALGTLPDEKWFDFPAPDQSLEWEWQDFISCVREGRSPQSDGRSAWKTLQLAEAIYEAASAQGAVVHAAGRIDSAGAPERNRLQPEVEYAGEKIR
ncbi:MAG TPA: Gfo/Idh/MocA family oxidoreductase [Terriglobales bacterium]|nr:Gfo/Idh/MocA family oxidoreductase [Terriglobales bacterium]